MNRAVDYVQERYRRSRRWRLVLAWFCGTTVAFCLWAVAFPSASGVATSAAQYMRDTLPHRFSLGTLRSHIPNDAAWSAESLAAMYWLTMILGLPAAATPVILRRAFPRTDYHRGLLLSAQLHEAIRRLRARRTRRARLRIVRLGLRFHLHRFVSPLVANWHRFPEFQPG